MTTPPTLSRMRATAARFWSKVDRGPECWVWQASKRAKGYGAFGWADGEGRVVQGRAHRFAWELERGPIPPGMCVLHRCDVPACVRPDHLFLGTKAENNRDMRAKGRAVRGGTWSRAGYKRGETHHASRLTARDVGEIRRLRADGLSYGTIAKQHGITGSHAYRVATGKAWAHLTAGGDGAEPWARA